MSRKNEKIPRYTDLWLKESVKMKKTLIKIVKISVKNENTQKMK